MTVRTSFMKIVQQDRLNFLLTNRIPRRLATSAMGWLSRIENPLVCAVSLRVWRMFSDVDLADAKQTRFTSMHDCFTRELKDGARPIDMSPGIVVSPCDGIVGASGQIDGCEVLQVKGFPYELADLLDDPAHAETFRDGCYVTLRLTAGMYHRFHAPHDCGVNAVKHIFGDVWNVNPVALKRVDRLFCRNERAVISTTLSGTQQPVTLVAVAAILVAGIRLRFLELPVGPERKIRTTYSCTAPFRRGQEMGWFEHGSTIVVLAPAGFALHDGIAEGAKIRVGQALLQAPPPAPSPAPLSAGDCVGLAP